MHAATRWRHDPRGHSTEAMLKDYVLAGSSAGSEEDFAGEYWDQRWEDRGERNPRTLADEVRRSEVYPDLQQALAGIPGARILDCGCGMGAWTLLLREQGFDAIGVDIAPKRIGWLRERFGDCFQERSFLETGYPADSFDVAFNWGGAEHFEAGLGLALGEAFRVLRPGGRLLFSTPAHNLRHMLRGFDDPAPASCSPNRRFYQYRFTRAEIIAELRAARFDVEVVRFFGVPEGVSRIVQGGRLARLGRARLLTAVGRRIAPAWLAAHMVLGVGRKPL